MIMSNRMGGRYRHGYPIRYIQPSCGASPSCGKSMYAYPPDAYPPYQQCSYPNPCGCPRCLAVIKPPMCNRPRPCGCPRCLAIVKAAPCHKMMCPPCSPCPPCPRRRKCRRKRPVIIVVDKNGQKKRIVEEKKKIVDEIEEEILVEDEDGNEEEVDVKEVVVEDDDGNVVDVIDADDTKNDDALQAFFQNQGDSANDAATKNTTSSWYETLFGTQTTTLVLVGSLIAVILMIYLSR